MILLDASVLLATEDADDPHHHDAVKLLRSGVPLATVDLALYEVTNVADARWGAADAGKRLRGRFWAIAAYGRLVRVDRALGDSVARLVGEHGLSAYDAAYVAAARKLGAPLASCDERDLVRTGLARSPGDCLPRPEDDEGSG